MKSTSSLLVVSPLPLGVLSSLCSLYLVCPFACNPCFKRVPSTTTSETTSATLTTSGKVILLYAYLHLLLHVRVLLLLFVLFSLDHLRPLYMAYAWNWESFTCICHFLHDIEFCTCWHIERWFYDGMMQWFSMVLHVYVVYRELTLCCRFYLCCWCFCLSS